MDGEGVSAGCGDSVLMGLGADVDNTTMCQEPPSQSSQQQYPPTPGWVDLPPQPLNPHSRHNKGEAWQLPFPPTPTAHRDVEPCLTWMIWASSSTLLSRSSATMTPSRIVWLACFFSSNTLATCPKGTERSAHAHTSRGSFDTPRTQNTEPLPCGMRGKPLQTGALCVGERIPHKGASANRQDPPPNPILYFDMPCAPVKLME